jgi:hypothetical protein
LAVTHIIAGAAYAIGGVVLTQSQDADCTGLALCTNASSAGLLGVWDCSADSIERGCACTHKTVVATRAGLGERRLAGFARLIAAALEALPRDFGGCIETICDARYARLTERSRIGVASRAICRWASV